MTGDMMKQEEEQILPKIGYLYHYPRMDHPTDKFRLDVHITSEPTNQHFDVLRVQYSVKTEGGTVKLMKVTHPWNYEKIAGISAGKVILEDRKGKKEEAFTFGGQLRIENQEVQTYCVLVSSAPILEISGATPVHSIFIEEIEIILAEKQAKYSNRQEYEQWLNKMEPLVLYRVCLEAILQKNEQTHQKTEKQYQFMVYLHSEKHRLEAAGLARNPIPKIDELLEK